VSKNCFTVTVSWAQSLDSDANVFSAALDKHSGPNKNVSTNYKM